MLTASAAEFGSGFNVTLPGTPRWCWDALDPVPWHPEEQELIVVAPHPDDETLGAGGLIHYYAQRQLRVTVVSVTDGEAACPEVEDLAHLRQCELRHALRTLTPQPIEIIRLGLPDGGVEAARTALADALNSLVSRHCLLVGPFERDGHTDHDATGAVTQQVALERGLTVAAYPIWAWHQATPEIFSGRSVVGLPLSPETRAAKQKAIRCYTSQLRERTGGPIVPSHVLSYFDRPYEVFLL
jgi:LmbE family N-acetylglucosaminyl deacetylase